MALPRQGINSLLHIRIVINAHICAQYNVNINQIHQSLCTTCVGVPIESINRETLHSYHICYPHVIA